MDRVADLRSDYDRLGTLLDAETDGAKAAAIVRERRQIGELLEALEKPVGEVPVVDQLAERRRAGSADSGSPSRRRRPG